MQCSAAHNIRLLIRKLRLPSFLVIWALIVANNTPAGFATAGVR